MPDTGLPDDDEFESFIEKYYPQLRRAAAGMVKDGHLAQDLAQETCVNLLRHYRSRKESGMDPMLTPSLAFTVLRHATASYFRTEATQRRRWQSAEIIASGMTGRDPGYDVSVAETTKRFFESLGPEQQKTALLLEAGYEPAEIGEILGKAEGTVRNYKTVIRNIFRQFFGS